MAEPIIKCPKCSTEIKLTESLAAPLVEQAKRNYEQDAIRQIAAAQDRIRKEEAAKAEASVATEIEERLRQMKELQARLAEQDNKLAEAQKLQAETLKKQRELDDAKRELELSIQKRVNEQIASVREHASREAEDSMRLKVAEREAVIESMQKQVEELRRKAEQGSQQLQGEVQEIELENSLKLRFLTDTIEPVGKGEHGGDVLQRVITPAGLQAGAILWESKRTKSWSDSWLPKLRDDQRAAKADIAILLTHTLPKEVETFDVIDGVWVTGVKTAMPLAITLRHAMIEAAMARQSVAGQGTKMELVYQYLTGPRFRQRVQAIVEAFSAMKEDLFREKKAITKQWAKREDQIERAMENTVGMYGDLQSIAGKTLPELESLSLPVLDSPPSKR